MRCAATVPFFTRPAAIGVSWRATAISPEEVTSSSGMPRDSAVSRSVGPNATAPNANRASANSSTGVPNPIRLNSMSGESRRDRSANSLIVSTSSRRCSEVTANGSASEMNPGLLPVAYSDVPHTPQARSTRALAPGSMPPGWWNSPRVVTMFEPDASSRHTWS
jgi:hypothetical protein